MGRVRGLQGKRADAEILPNQLQAIHQCGTSTFSFAPAQGKTIALSPDRTAEVAAPDGFAAFIRLQIYKALT
jgi:hypothetical protein